MTLRIYPLHLGTALIGQVFAAILVINRKDEGYLCIKKF